MNALTVEIHIEELASSEADEPGPPGTTISDRPHTQSPLSNQYFPCIPDCDSLKAWAALAYLNKEPAEVSLAIVTNSTIRELNKQYRKKDKPTNVLSFPADSSITPAPKLLGDVIFCPTVIEQEALAQHKWLLHHWAHMCVHGMLHLQGYDHEDEQAANEMEKLEIELLAKLEIPNPYLID